MHSHLHMHLHHSANHTRKYVLDSSATCCLSTVYSLLYFQVFVKLLLQIFQKFPKLSLVTCNLSAL